METITKKYKIYQFKELNKKVQKQILDFQFRSQAANNFMSNGKMPSLSFLKALPKYVKNEAKQMSYFKSGEIAHIPDD